MAVMVDWVLKIDYLSIRAAIQSGLQILTELYCYYYWYHFTLMNNNF